MKNHKRNKLLCVCRINSREYDSFRRRIRCPIRVKEGVTIRKSLTENFLVAFREQVVQNDKAAKPEVNKLIFEFSPNSCVGGTFIFTLLLIGNRTLCGMLSD